MKTFGKDFLFTSEIIVGCVTILFSYLYQRGETLIWVILGLIVIAKFRDFAPTIFIGVLLDLAMTFYEEGNTVYFKRIIVILGILILAELIARIIVLIQRKALKYELNISELQMIYMLFAFIGMGIWAGWNYNHCDNYSAQLPVAFQSYLGDSKLTSLISKYSSCTIGSVVNQAEMNQVGNLFSGGGIESRLEFWLKLIPRILIASPVLIVAVSISLGNELFTKFSLKSLVVNTFKITIFGLFYLIAMGYVLIYVASLLNVTRIVPEDFLSNMIPIAIIFYVFGSVLFVTRVSIVRGMS